MIVNLCWTTAAFSSFQSAVSECMFLLRLLIALKTGCGCVQILYRTRLVLTVLFSLLI